MPERTPSAGANQRLVSGPFVMVTAATFVFFVYVGVQVPLIPRLVEEHFGGDELAVGINLAVFSLTAVAARPALARFAERHTLRLLMFFGALLTAAATVASAYAPSLWVLLALRGVQGVGEASVFIGGASLISGFAPPERRAEAASYFSVAVFGGIGIGPIIGEAVVGPDGRFAAGLFVAAVFAACGAFGALAVPQRMIAGATLGAPESDHGGSRVLIHRAALRPGVILACGIGGFTAFNAYMPEHAKDIGLSGSQWVFATYSIGCLVLRIVAAKFPERVGLARAVSIAGAGLISGLAVLAFVPTIPGVFVAALLLAVGMSFQYPSLMTMAVNAAPDQERTMVLSSFTMFFDVGTILGALALGFVANVTSKRGGFFGGAVLCAVGLVLLWRWLVPWERRTTLHRAHHAPELTVDRAAAT
jgi:MFS family permease